MKFITGGFLTIFAIFALFKGINCLEISNVKGKGKLKDSFEDLDLGVKSGDGGPYKEKYGEVDHVPSWANPDLESEPVYDDDDANIDENEYLVDFPKALKLTRKGQENEKVDQIDSLVDHDQEGDQDLDDLIEKISRNRGNFDDNDDELKIFDGQMKEESGIIEVENGGFFIWKQIKTIINFQPEAAGKNDQYDQQGQVQSEWTIIGEFNSDSDLEDKIENENLLNFINYIELRSERIQSLFGLLLIALSMVGICSIFIVILRMCDALLSDTRSRNHQEENPPPEYELVISEDQYLKNFAEFNNEKEYSTIILEKNIQNV